jgi:hypothetical protein
MLELDVQECARILDANINALVVSFCKVEQCSSVKTTVLHGINTKKCHVQVSEALGDGALLY